VNGVESLEVRTRLNLLISLEEVTKDGLRSSLLYQSCRLLAWPTVL
jgi:hypothetical protein